MGADEEQPGYIRPGETQTSGAVKTLQAVIISAVTSLLQERFLTELSCFTRNLKNKCEQLENMQVCC